MSATENAQNLDCANLSHFTVTEEKFMYMLLYMSVNCCERKQSPVKCIANVMQIIGFMNLFLYIFFLSNLVKNNTLKVLHAKFVVEILFLNLFIYIIMF